MSHSRQIRTNRHRANNQHHYVLFNSTRIRRALKVNPNRYIRPNKSRRYHNSNSSVNTLTPSHSRLLKRHPHPNKTPNQRQSTNIEISSTSPIRIVHLIILNQRMSTTLRHRRVSSRQPIVDTNTLRNILSLNSIIAVSQTSMLRTRILRRPLQNSSILRPLLSPIRHIMRKCTRCKHTLGRTLTPIRRPLVTLNNARNNRVINRTPSNQKMQAAVIISSSSRKAIPHDSIIRHLPQRTANRNTITSRNSSITSPQTTRITTSLPSLDSTIHMQRHHKHVKILSRIVNTLNPTKMTKRTITLARNTRIITTSNSRLISMNLITNIRRSNVTQ